MHPRHRPRACAVLLAAAAASAGAQTAPIERVTVYPGLAEVERVARVAAGSRELVLDCLSAQFDMGTLRIEADAAVRTGALSALNRPREQAPQCQVTPLDERVKALEDRLAALDAEHEGHALALGYLRALAPADPASAPRQSAPAGSLAQQVAALQKAGQSALGEQHRIERAREALRRELAPLQAERDRQLQQGGEVRQLRIALAASGDGQIRLRYQVPGPTWAPAYRAQLDSASGALEIERLAQVLQRSGEDWRGVALVLSTGSPRAATAGPQPRPWTLAVREREPAAEVAVQSMRLKAAPAAAPAPAMATADGLDFAVQMQEGEYATEFVLPGKVDIGSSAQRVALSLGRQRFSATLLAQAVPAQDASAWLLAELPRPAGIWPDGPLQLLRDGQAVGSSTLRLGQRATLSLPFGRDDKIRVQVLQPPAQQASTGFIGQRSERRVARRYEIENRHATPIELRVLESSPVSTDERVQVDKRFEPAPLTQAWQDEAGVVAWQRRLAAGERWTLQADYQITWPKDQPLAERR
ncbi:DUF4139 domain-containing protein [Ideonella sp. 4Y11]|uniref:DUF4139 domain-containing protein n=1 Tax=Ideonella aquatica TaxID=2824119 RepID=A0A941BP13_9BURK|nr:DUF4139 domain-containing protein [Ideonella aquatica]MBQ0957570.1 DUF4139 domain-containing protein [Ideonella aquatica]